MSTKARPEIKTTEPEATPTPNFTVQQIENRLVAVLAPALQAKGGSAHTFAEWSLAGHGIVLVLSTGQEFWLTLAEAYLPASTSTPR
jgi:hypothetical protein